MKCKYISQNSFIRFIMVGVLNTIIGTLVMFLCYNYFHLGYWISTVSNYVIGSIFSYFANKYFTFREKKKSIFEILHFVVNIIICYLIAYGFAKPFTIFVLLNVFGLKISYDMAMNIAMLIGMGLFVIINYVGQRMFVFKLESTRIDE